MNQGAPELGAHLKYRPEIDGLRAIAVIAVILQHAKLGIVPGGYVGVDVFFVISGFLISSIIYSQIEERRFSIWEFYERRARRIIPALVSVILVTAAACHFLMMPDSYENFGQSVLATMLFSNNILLTITSGYWDLASDFKPLLHTWSLGVEEQFYVIYPLVALLIVRSRKSLFVPALCFIGVTSLALSVFLSKDHPNSSFYMLHTRAWELILGALSARYLHGIKPAGGHAALAGLGLSMIFGSMLVIREGVPYPHFYALLPCLGTALVLVFATGDTFVGRFLSRRALVGIGLISYSAYLWHQPLFALARVSRLSEPPGWLYLLLVATTLFLAYLTWRYVETPFRDRKFLTQKQVLGAAAISSVALGGVGLALAATHGLPARVPGLGVGQESYIAYNQRVFRFKNDQFALDNRKKLLVLGNSTGRDLVNMMNESGRFGRYEIVYRDDLDPCKPIAPRFVDLVRSADAVVVASNWGYDGKCRAFTTDRPPLAGKMLILVGPKHFGYNIDTYVRTPMADRPKVRATLLPTTEPDDELYRRLAPPGRYVSQLAHLKARYGGVPVFNERGQILSVDRVHLTRAGAVLFARVMFDDPAWNGLDLAPPT